MLLVVLTLLAQAGEAKDAAGLTPAALAGIITAAATAGAAVLGSITVYRKRKDDARKMETEEDSITITQAQGANLVLDATVKALNTQLDRESLRADRERGRAEKAEERVRTLSDQLDSEQARATTAERALAVCRRQMADSAGGGQ